MLLSIRSRKMTDSKNFLYKLLTHFYRKGIANEKKQKQCYQDMLDSLQDKQDQIQRMKDLEEEENRLYLIHLAKKVERQKNFAQQKEEVERAKEKIFKKLKAE